MDVRIRLAELEREGDLVLAVQRAGYAVEARLIGVDSLPPQHETVADLRAEQIWVAEARDEIAGERAIRVGTAAANGPALELYRSLGFRRVGQRTVGDDLAYVDLLRPAREAV